jgi:hypothetical protein
MSMGSTKKYREPASPPATESNKVAQSLSPYITHAETMRSASPQKTKPLHIAGLPVSDDVWHFAQENTLVPHVETTIRLLRETFEEIRNIRLEYGIDPEIPNWDSIDIHFYVAGTVDELLQADQKFTRAYVVTVPDEPRSKICPLLWVL